MLLVYCSISISFPINLSWESKSWKRSSSFDASVATVSSFISTSYKRWKKKKESLELITTFKISERLFVGWRMWVSGESGNPTSISVFAQMTTSHRSSIRRINLAIIFSFVILYYNINMKQTRGKNYLRYCLEKKYNTSSGFLHSNCQGEAAISELGTKSLSKSSGELKYSVILV